MDEFSKTLADAFGAELNFSRKFSPQAYYYDGMDYVEYLCSDVLTVSQRVDKFLTLIWDSSRENLVGFRIKGFRCLFNQKLKPLFNFADKDFLPLISVIQAVVEDIGSDLIDSVERENAYKKVFILAEKKNAKLYDVPFRDAA